MNPFSPLSLPSSSPRLRAGFAAAALGATLLLGWAIDGLAEPAPAAAQLALPAPSGTLARL